MTEKKRQQCSGCGCLSPEVESNYTLIGAGYGWRLEVAITKDGRREPLLLCPVCWKMRKAPTTR